MFLEQIRELCADCFFQCLTAFTHGLLLLGIKKWREFFVGVQKVVMKLQEGER